MKSKEIDELSNLWYNLRNLQNHSSWQGNDLARTVASIYYETEKEKRRKAYLEVFDPRFQKFLRELKEAGYKRVYVGCKNPYWSNHPENSFIAEPSIEIERRPALWNILGEYFGMGCGSGHGGWDQGQTCISILEEYRKVYEL